MKKLIAVVMILALTLALFAGCGEKTGSNGKDGNEGRVLKVAMECAYAPYNWTQSTDANGAVPISGSGDYANGYDVMMAKKICDANGWTLEIMRMDWDSLIPAVQTGQIDAVIAGQSMTADRMEQVDFAGPYLYATIVCLTKADSPLANAKGISVLAGHSCTSQASTIWYDTCLPQIEGAEIKAPKDGAPLMLTALESGEVEFVCCDMPTAQGAVQAFNDLVILDFAGSGDDFVVDEGDINIGISVQKGNTELRDAINNALKGMTADDFNKMMADAIAIQPMNED
jgi:putative lysine transport system substrate-binding protein